VSLVLVVIALVLTAFAVGLFLGGLLCLGPRDDKPENPS